MDKTKQFMPFNPATDTLLDRPAHAMVLAVRPFLVEMGRDLVLLDTGLGFSQHGQQQIITALEQQGVGPEQVTQVILSHLHKDHTGGIGHQLADGSWQMNFPKATYYVQQRERTFARQQTGNPSYHEPTLRALVNHPQVIYLHADEGYISPHIRYQVSGGHTPYHQVITIQDTEQIAFFGADELPQAGYLHQNFAYKNDYDGKRAMHSRTRWIEQSKAEGWTLLFYHDRLIPKS